VEVTAWFAVDLRPFGNGNGNGNGWFAVDLASQSDWADWNASDI
jgi:hypothetical protein